MVSPLFYFSSPVWETVWDFSLARSKAFIASLSKSPMLYTISEFYDRDQPIFYKAIQSVRKNDIDLTGSIISSTGLRPRRSKCIGTVSGSSGALCWTRNTACVATFLTVCGQRTASVQPPCFDKFTTQW